MRKRFQIIILLMALSLFILIVIQALWITYAVKTERSKFDQLVYDAMNRALNKVEQNQVFNFIDSRLDLPEPEINISMQIKELEDLEEDPQEIEEIEIESRINRQEQVLIISGDSNYDSRKLYLHSPDVNTDVDIDLSESPQAFYYQYRLNDSLIYSSEDYVIYNNSLDSITKILELKNMEMLVRKEELVKKKLKVFNENIEQWVMEFSFDDNVFFLESRIDNHREQLQKALIDNGIYLDFDYQIIKQDDSGSAIISSENREQLIPQQYKKDFSPDDIFSKGLLLVLNFPDRNSHIYNKVIVLVLGSVIFTLIIIMTFGFTLFYMQKQKKISEVKSDFINNMTHEFKTPIATIRLATDAMESPKVMGAEKQTKYYLDIIRQENKRMNSQVERVLQMALIDRGQLDLDIQPINMHEILSNCITVIDLLAKKKGGTVSASLRATEPMIMTDEIHIANVINNLLDNAIKYTENAPQVLVETYNKGNQLYIKIIDNGIGMSKEVVNHIFDKFYRKPAGNIHNVKGFGLGLSYVKAVVSANNGEINVTSEPGNGSTFILKFNIHKD